MPKVLQQLRGNEFFRSVFTLISANSIVQLIAILIYPILTDIYTPSEHGTFALYLSIITITGIICTLKYEAAVMMPAENRKAINLAALSMIISLIISLVLMLLILFFRNTFTSWFEDASIYKWMYFIPLSTFLIGMFQTFSYLSNRKKQYKRIALSNASQSLMNSGIKISTSRLFGPGAGLIIGAIAGQVIGAVIYLWGFIRNESTYLKEISIHEMRRAAAEYSFFPRYNLIHNLTNNFSGNLPVFVISYYYSSAEVGLYSLGFLMVFRPMSIITGSFSQVFSQNIISRYNQGEKIYDRIKLIAVRLFQFGLPFFLIAGLFGPVIFKSVFGSTWITSGKYMQVLLPWLFIVFISSPLSFIPDMLNSQKKAMWLDILKLVARITALWIGVYFNNLYLALILFSFLSMIFTGYSLYWYISLAHIADINKAAARILPGETNFAIEEKYEF
jgi:O-antigen/teichoic acid export membrane protein